MQAKVSREVGGLMFQTLVLQELQVRPDGAGHGEVGGLVDVRGLWLHEQAGVRLSAQPWALSAQGLHGREQRWSPLSGWIL